MRPGNRKEGEPEYVFEHGECSLEYERQLAEKDYATLGVGNFRGFYVVPIGWTTLRHEGIVGMGEEVMDGLDGEGWEEEGEMGVQDREKLGLRKEVPFEVHCQRFLKGLAEEILEQHKAEGWEWFRDNVTCEYKDVGAKLMAGPQRGHGEAGTRLSWGGRARSLFRAPLASVDAGVRAWAYGRAG